MEAGDLIITGTDGLFDNLSVGDIKSIVLRENYLSSSSGRAYDKQSISQWLKHLVTTITENALMTALISVKQTPFAVQARRAGFEHRVSLSIRGTCFTVDRVVS